MAPKQQFKVVSKQLDSQLDTAWGQVGMEIQAIRNSGQDEIDFVQTWKVWNNFHHFVKKDHRFMNSHGQEIGNCYSCGKVIPMGHVCMECNSPTGFSVALGWTLVKSDDDRSCQKPPSKCFINPAVHASLNAGHNNGAMTCISAPHALAHVVGDTNRDVKIPFEETYFLETMTKHHHTRLWYSTLWKPFYEGMCSGISEKKCDLPGAQRLFIEKVMVLIHPEASKYF